MVKETDSFISDLNKVLTKAQSNEIHLPFMKKSKSRVLDNSVIINEDDSKELTPISHGNIGCLNPACGS